MKISKILLKAALPCLLSATMTLGFISPAITSLADEVDTDSGEEISETEVPEEETESQAVTDNTETEDITEDPEQDIANVSEDTDLNEPAIDEETEDEISEDMSDVDDTDPEITEDDSEESATQDEDSDSFLSETDDTATSDNTEDIDNELIDDSVEDDCEIEFEEEIVVSAEVEAMFAPLGNNSTLTTADVQSKIDTLVAQGLIGKKASNRQWNNCYDFVNYLSNKFYGCSIGSQANCTGDSKCLLTGNSANFDQVGITLSNAYNDSNVSCSEENLKNLFMQAQPGDIVQMDYTLYGGDSVHVLMIYSVSDTGVIFYHYYSYKDKEGNYDEYGNVMATIGGCSSGDMFPNNPSSLSTEVSYASLANSENYSNLKGADDGVSIYRPKCVINGCTVSDADSFMAALDDARTSSSPKTIILNKSITIKIGDYLSAYPEVVSSNSSSANRTIIFDNVIIKGINDSISLSLESGNSYWTWATVTDTATIELGPDLNPPYSTGNSCFSVYGITNYGTIKNVNSQNISNKITGTIDYCLCSDTVNGNHTFINYGKVNWVLGAIGTNYGEIDKMTVRGAFTNYGKVSIICSRSYLSNYGYNCGHTDGTFTQYGGSVFKSYLDGEKFVLYGGSLQIGEYSSSYDYSITLSNLNWNQETGYKQYSEEQAYALSQLRVISNKETSWYSPDESGNITFSFKVSDAAWMDQFIFKVSTLVADYFYQYSMNIYSDCSVTDLAEGNFSLNMNGRKITFDGNSPSMNVPNHVVLDNGSILIRKPYTITCPNTLVLNNVSIETEDIDGAAFICDNGRVVFNNCTSVNGSPIAVQLTSSSDTIEIINADNINVQYLSADETASEDVDFVVIINSDIKGIACIDNQPADSGTDIVIVPDFNRAVEEADGGTVMLMSDATVEDLTIDSDCNLVINEGVTLNVEGTVVIDGTISGNGTINVGSDAICIQNSTIEDTVKIVGWSESNGNKYYYNNDGVAATGWTKIEKKWYYFDSDGIMKTGWQKVSGEWYYLSSDGIMQKGWQKISGKWYYLNSKGIMQTGWQKVSGKWYYLDSKGIMQTGWQKVSKKWYYLGTDGIMCTEWQKIGGKWYYFGTDGIMKTKWQKINNKWYYFGTDGKMVTKNTKIGSKVYKFNSSGVCLNP